MGDYYQDGGSGGQKEGVGRTGRTLHFNHGFSGQAIQKVSDVDSSNLQPVERDSITWNPLYVPFPPLNCVVKVL